MRKFDERRDWGSRDLSVIPAKAGIQVGWVVVETSSLQTFTGVTKPGMDTGLRRYDGKPV